MGQLGHELHANMVSRHGTHNDIALLLRQAESEGGWVIVADVESFPISKDMSGALVKLHPGGMRQLHWHTNLDEWQFVINGTIQVHSPHNGCTLLYFTSGVLGNGST